MTHLFSRAHTQARRAHTRECHAAYRLKAVHRGGLVVDLLRAQRELRFNCIGGDDRRSAARAPRAFQQTHKRRRERGGARWHVAPEL